MDTTVLDRYRGGTPDATAKRPWTTPCLVVYGCVPALTFAQSVTKLPP